MLGVVALAVSGGAGLFEAPAAETQQSGGKAEPSDF